MHTKLKSQIRLIRWMIRRVRLLEIRKRTCQVSVIEISYTYRCIYKQISENFRKMRYRKETISHFARNNLMREGKKYKYYFFDYLYYRLYVVYRKHNEAARFSACLLLGMVSMIIFFFFSIFFNKVLTDDWFSLENFTPIQIQSIFVGVGILCFIAFFLRYTRKRTAAILLKYKGNMWNKIIPAWMIYCSPLLVFLVGIGICKLIYN